MQTKGHTNLYLNYRKLSELPGRTSNFVPDKEALFEEKCSQKVGTMCNTCQLRGFRSSFGSYIVLTVCTFALQPADIWKLENLVEL